MAEAWSSLLPQLLSLSASEASSLAVVLDELGGKTNDYFSPSKPKRACLLVVGSFSKNIFLALGNPRLASLLRGVDTTTLVSVLPIILDHSNDVSSTLHLVDRTVLVTTEGFLTDLSSLKIEVGLLRDSLGVDPGLADIHLRTA